MNQSQRAASAMAMFRRAVAGEAGAGHQRHGDLRAYHATEQLFWF
jgi:hypothetical protein